MADERNQGSAKPGPPGLPNRRARRNALREAGLLRAGPSATPPLVSVGGDGLSARYAFFAGCAITVATAMIQQSWGWPELGRAFTFGCAAFLIAYAIVTFPDGRFRGGGRLTASAAAALLVCASLFFVAGATNKAETTAPQFTAQIMQVEKSQALAAQPHVETSLWALVQNTGGDSVVQPDWQLEIKSKDGLPLHPVLEKHEGDDYFVTLKVKENGGFPDFPLVVTEKPTDQLWYSAYDYAITKEQGGRGRLTFSIPDAESTATLDLTSARVSFIDPYGHVWYSAYYNPRKDRHDHLPGQPFPELMNWGLSGFPFRPGLPNFVSLQGPTTYVHFQTILPASATPEQRNEIDQITQSVARRFGTRFGSP